MCKEDSLLRIKKQREREVIAECTWCGAVQRRWAGYHSSRANAKHLVHNKHPEPPDLERALRAYDMSKEGLKGPAIAAELGVTPRRVWKLLTIARTHHGIPTKSTRKAIMELSHDRLMCYLILHSSERMSDPAICKYIGVSHQTLINIKARQGLHTPTPQRLRKAERASKLQKLQKLRAENPKRQTKDIAAELGLTAAVAYEMVRELKRAEAEQAAALSRLGQWYDREEASVAA